MKQVATITVIGRDKTGVIAKVTQVLFAQRANIEALEEQVTRGQFSMVLQASWKPAAWRPKEIQAALEATGKELGMEIKFRPSAPRGRQRFAILVTREPHCLEALLRELKAGRLKAQPAVILSNYPDLGPIARAHGIPFKVIRWDDRAKAEINALRVLEEAQVDFLVLGPGS